jgi:hypothetical protein
MVVKIHARLLVHNKSFQFFIYMCTISEAMGQLHCMERKKKQGQKTQIANRAELRLFKLTHKFLKVSCRFTNCISSRCTCSRRTVTGGVTEHNSYVCSGKEPK